MATYTDNYNLTKPTLAEVADVRPLNGNMDKIDEVMHASQVSLAEAYDQTKTYSAGDVVMYEFFMYKCLATTTGNWDATKWERTTAAETGGGGSVDFDLYGEASGNPASFVDGSASALVECETEIVPVQDLHGYSKPWAGGAGKNKAEGRYQWNVNASGEIISSSNYATCIVKVSLNETYTFSVDGTLAQIDVLAFYASMPQIGSVSYNNSRQTFTSGTFTAPITGYAVIRMDANIGNMQVEVGSSATAYEPYSNICPISGHSSVTINVSSTNDPSQGVDTTIQLGDTYYSGTLNVVTGELTVTHRVITENNFISVSSGTSGGGLHYANCDLSESEATSANAISNMLVQNQSGWGSTTPCFATNTGSAPNIYPVRIYCSESTLADFKAAYSGLQICYELATPITVQIPPTTINTLLGQNYISSDDTEDLDIVYTKSGAPIKPNPTGAAVGELNKIELDGEVFEIAGSGGGTNVLGAFIDTTNVIYDSFVFDGTEHTWTATSDCMLAGSMDAPSSSTSCYIEIDGIEVFIDYETHNGIIIPVKEGQTITYLAKSGSVMKAYGLTYGSTTVPKVHYSENEQVIGTDEDGKTIYEKTFKVASPTWTSGSGYSTITVDISSIGTVDKLSFVRGTVYENNDDRTFDIPYFRIADSESLLYECRVNSDGSPYLVLFVRASSGAGYSLSNLSVTLQYTKSSS